jgi:DNA-binding SARP family transcriptional activator
VAVDSLVDELWGDAVPGDPAHALQQQISALRKLLVAAAGSAQEVVERRGAGYALAASAYDSIEFEQAVERAREHAAATRWADAEASLAAALAAWRGPAFADARDTPRLHAAAQRLDSMRVTATEARFDALLAMGRAADAIPALRAAVTEAPMHEQFRAQLVLALYRSGRQADALAELTDARRALRDALGLEPGPELRALEQQILDHDPKLLAPMQHRSPPESQADPELFATFRAGGAGHARVEYPDGQVVVIGDEPVLIGRDPRAPIRFVDSRVSRRHAEIERRADGYWLRDLDSTNGTSVDGRRIEEHKLSDREVISVGGLALTFRATAV